MSVRWGACPRCVRGTCTFCQINATREASAFEDAARKRDLEDALDRVWGLR